MAEKKVTVLFTPKGVWDGRVLVVLGEKLDTTVSGHSANQRYLMVKGAFTEEQIREALNKTREQLEMTVEIIGISDPKLPFMPWF